jgi:hypothetical protein
MKNDEVVGTFSMDERGEKYNILVGTSQAKRSFVAPKRR